MNKELDIQNIKKALLCYIKENGYTKSSLAKKCDIESSLFKLFFNEELSVKRDIAEAIIYTVLEEEKITLIELMKYTEKSKGSDEIGMDLINSSLVSFGDKKRDVKRIPIFLKELEEFWILNQDLRFGQVFSILENELGEDSFNAEEDKWMKALDRLKNRNI